MFCSQIQETSIVCTFLWIFIRVFRIDDTNAVFYCFHISNVCHPSTAVYIRWPSSWKLASSSRVSGHVSLKPFNSVFIARRWCGCRYGVSRSTPMKLWFTVPIVRISRINERSKWALIEILDVRWLCLCRDLVSQCLVTPCQSDD